MKRQIIYVHGGDSFTTPEDFLRHLKTVPLRSGFEVSPGLWPDTLRGALGEDFAVCMPSFPNKQNARYEEWRMWFSRYLELSEDGVILVGWSLGGMFLAKYLSEEPALRSVRALFLLAAPGGEFVAVDSKGNDCLSFKPQKENLSRLEKEVPHIAVWHSTDDPIVPVSEADWYSRCLPSAKQRIFVDKNHFLTAQLPELIEAIKGL